MRDLSGKRRGRPCGVPAGQFACGSLPLLLPNAKLVILQQEWKDNKLAGHQRVVSGDPRPNSTLLGYVPEPRCTVEGGGREREQFSYMENPDE